MLSIGYTSIVVGEWWGSLFHNIDKVCCYTASKLKKTKKG